MSNIQPATIGQFISKKLNERLLGMTSFIEQTDFGLLRLEDDAKKLAKSDAPEAWRNLALIALMRGNVDAFEQRMANAEKLSNDPVANGLARLCGYTNLSFASKALDLYKKVVDIKHGSLGAAAVSGISIGAFQQIARVMTQARAAQIVLPHAEQMALAEKAAAFLQPRGVSDEMCARVVDAAGEVLRGHRLFWSDLHPKISMNDADGSVSMCLKVDSTYQHASAMTMETAERLIAEDLDTLPFYVSFLGTRSA